MSRRRRAGIDGEKMAKLERVHIDKLAPSR